MVVLGELSDKIIKSNRLGDLLNAVDEKKCDSWQKANIKLIKRKRERALAVDTELAKNLTKASMECNAKWVEARKANDFKSLQPYLENVVNITTDIANGLSKNFKCSSYDALLDSYDPGRKTEDVEKIAKELRNFLPSFIQEVVEKQKSWKVDIFDKDIFSAEKQKELGLHCMKSVGFDFSRGRLDTSVHPFCGGGNQDIRITTRYNEKEFLSSLMGIMHETGHGLYQQNLPMKYYNQKVGDNLGMSIHESQSLFLEIQISRTKEFMEFIFPKAKKIFGFKDKNYSAENFYKVANKVTPSLIRVDSDEVTYPLHVILRFELEQAIIKGDLKIKDLPGVWNEKMKQYLGLT
ncbi:MAG: carboxypeptidase M32, partial [Alphaproteobacteria bacterium]|nr:carboxypeptidase M32 [Alphaproteobacteria bacterium]